MKKQASTTHFFYQNGKLVTVNQGQQNRTIFRSADVPLAEQKTGDQQDTGLLGIDHHSSVLNVSVTTDDEESHSYSGYGHDPSLPSTHTMSGFNGEHMEPEAAGYLLGNGYRLYNPAIMRFLSADSMSPFDEGGLNAYCYCLGDPINRTDPDGHFSLFKPRTWFRSTETKITQRFDQLKLSNEKILNLTGDFKKAQKNQATFGKFGPTYVESTEKALTTELGRAKRKTEGITKYNITVHESYLTPQKEARQAISIRSADKLAFRRKIAEDAENKRQKAPVRRKYWEKDESDERNYAPKKRDEIRN